MFQQISEIENEKDGAEIFSDLEDSKTATSKGEIYSLEKDLKAVLDNINVGFQFTWGGALEDDYYIDPQEDNYYHIYVNECLKEFKFDVSGNNVEYLIGYYGEKKPLFIKKSGKIYFNISNQLIPDRSIGKVEVGFLKVVLILYLNYIRCKNKADVLYNTAIADLSY